MTFAQIAKVSIWLSRIGTAFTLATLVFGLFVPKPLVPQVLGLAMWFAFGALSNNFFHRLCLHFDKVHQRNARRRAWLEACKR